MTARPDLTIEGIQVRFGGLIAVENVNLHAPAGRITGLIGPNGAGKSTTFNACTGLVKPTTGTVRLGAHDLSHASSAKRARLGLGRTFQRMELWDAMTVSENVTLGHEARQVGRGLRTHLCASPTERRTAIEHAKVAMATCGIEELADLAVGQLSTGNRRLVELARVIAGGFEFLLLDEPSSGLDEAETEAFGDVLSQLVSEQEIGILLVEHDMSLVRRICQYIYVLDFGRLIYEAPTDEALASEIVRSAYLGSVEVA